MSTLVSTQSLLRAIAALVVFHTAPVHAALVWPNLGPSGSCRAGLQACIDSLPPGDEVVIGNDDIAVSDGYTAINENIVISKSFTLRAMDGVDAVWLADRIVQVETPLTGNTAVTLDRLIFARGRVRLYHQSAGTTTFSVSRLRFRDVVAGDGSGTLCAVLGVDAGAGVATFNIGDSVLMARPAPQRDGICLRFNEGEAHANVFRNRIDAVDGGLRHAMYVGGLGGGTLTFSANQIDGSGFDTGIGIVREGTGALPLQLRIDNNVIQGMDRALDGTGSNAAIKLAATQEVDASILHNTLARNNYGIVAAPASGGSTLPTGRIANNIVAFNRYGGILLSTAAPPALSNGFNLVHANGSNVYTPGPGTLMLDPQLQGARNLRPRAGSPVIEAGNNADIVAAELFDADGELRRVGSTDIGAFEFTGGRSGLHLTRAGNSAGNATVLESELASDNPDSRIQVTPLRSAEPSPNLGVFLGEVGSSGWRLFNQGAQTMMPGRRFAVSADGAGTLFTHTATAANTSVNFTQLDHAELNSRSFAIATLTSNSSPAAAPAGFAFDELAELDYVSPRWRIAIPNVTVPMPVNRSFNLRIAPLLSPNAFVSTLIEAALGGAVPLHHRLLDNRPCAAPMVSRSREPHNTANPFPFALEYRSADALRDGHWHIVPDAGTSTFFPLLSSFNVIVDGASGNSCAGEIIMDDGLE
jgi:hypothetical protein